MAQQIDGHEAYRDDPAYTAPEMQPGNGEDLPPESDNAFAIATGAGMTMGAAGGALAGTVLIDEVEDEKAQTTVNPDPAA